MPRMQLEALAMTWFCMKLKAVVLETVHWVLSWLKALQNSGSSQKTVLFWDFCSSVHLQLMAMWRLKTWPGSQVVPLRLSPSLPYQVRQVWWLMLLVGQGRTSRHRWVTPTSGEVGVRGGKKLKVLIRGTISKKIEIDQVQWLWGDTCPRSFILYLIQFLNTTKIIPIYTWRRRSSNFIWARLTSIGASGVFFDFGTSFDPLNLLILLLHSHSFIILIMANPNPNNKDSANEILKKIEQETPEQKLLKTKQILQGKAQPIVEPKPKVDYLRIAANAYTGMVQKMQRKLANPEYQRLYIFSGFFIFASVVAWKIEAKYDNLRKKATRTKTFKQAQIEQQNEYINKFLTGREFQPVPISDEPEFKKTYNYEMQENVLDTRDDFYQMIAKEYRQGKPVDENMLAQLKQRGYV